MPVHTNPDKPGTIGDGKPKADNATTTAANEVDGAYADGPALPRTNKVVLVMDLVESVRLMAQDESGVVARWHGFTKKASKLIPRHRGRIVKSLGDGLLAEFDHSRDAVQVATALHKMIQPANQGRGQDQQLWLRVGINATPVYVDSIDIYGSGVNLAARLAGLAGPGETIASASVRDQLTDGLDADVEDMGECYLKHVEEPVRAYRVGPPGPRPVLVPEKEYNTPLQPTIAVIPFTSRSNAPEHFAIGELIADELIEVLGRSSLVKVIARLSTSVFQSRPANSEELSLYLNADFAVLGNYAVVGTGTNAKMVISYTLIKLIGNNILRTQSLRSTVGDLFIRDSEIIGEIASQVVQQMAIHEVNDFSLYAAPNLPSYSLMLAAAKLMHHSSPSDFYQSLRAMEVLNDRHPSYSDVKSWIAFWYVLKITRGLSTDRKKDGQLAIDYCKRALDTHQINSFAKAIEGFIHCHVAGDMGAALKSLTNASEINANNSLAWLFSSVVNSFIGESAAATEASTLAIELSPLDPIRYYYESLAASSALSANDLTKAIKYCNNSLRLNRYHIPTYRTLLTAHWRSGDAMEAQHVAKKLLSINPNATVDAYLASSTAARFPFGKEIGVAMAAAGIPIH